MDVKQRFPIYRLRLVCVIAFGLISAVAFPPSVAADSITPPPVPVSLEVWGPNEAYLVGHAVGTQNYICLPAASIGHVAWTLFTPQATLFDDESEQMLTHFFSPNPAEGGTIRAAWQDSQDTSTVWARATASSSDSSFVAPGAIPWLKLEVLGRRTGPTGGDTVAGTTFIQRVNTAGGVAPSTGCDLPTDIGRKAFVPYTADYVFYQETGSN